MAFEVPTGADAAFQVGTDPIPLGVYWSESLRVEYHKREAETGSQGAMNHTGAADTVRKLMRGLGLSAGWPQVHRCSIESEVPTRGSFAQFGRCCRNPSFENYEKSAKF